MTAQQLKNSILQMAVQGKLVPQDPNDEPASVLLERIRAEKERLIKEKKIKREKNPSVIFKGADNTPYEKIGDEVRSLADEVPFDIPDSWEWVRHNDLFEISGGSQPPKSKFISEARDGYIRLYQIRDYGNNPVPVYIPISAASKISHKGDILLARYGASLGKVFWAEDGAYNVAMARVIPLYETELISKEFLFLFYQSSLYQSVIHANSRSAQAGFNKEDLSSLFFPLPPRSEQKRIVCAYEKLQPFLNAYDDAAHSLAIMNKGFPEALKKSILQEAVQGKLVPQDPSDEPAEALLERIRAEKQRLIKEGKIKKDKHESVIFRRDNSHYEKLDGVERCIDDELPFEIPENWCWCKIGTIFTLQAGKNIQAAEIHENPFTDSHPCYGGNGIRGYVASSNRTGDYPIIGRQGALCGNISRATGEFYATEHAVCVETYSQISVAWACLFLTALNLNQYATATAQPGLAVANINEVYIPLPPLAEQHRIVQRIEELLPLVKGL